MTKNLSYKEGAACLNVSIPHFKKMLRDYNVERFSDAPRAPYVITNKTIDYLKERAKSRGRAAQRCEPCKHSIKKKCGLCGLSICINDYRETLNGMPSARCKNCENKIAYTNRGQAPL